MGWRLWSCCGTTYRTATLGTWQNGNFLGPSTISNGMSSTSNSFEIGDVGWYIDPNNTGVAPPWEMRSEVDALTESMRYWYPARVGHGLAVSATGIGRTGAAHPVQMRATAALSLVGTPGVYDGAASLGVTSITTAYGNQWYYEFDGVAATGLTAVRELVLYTSASSYIACDARM